MGCGVSLDPYRWPNAFLLGARRLTVSILIGKFCSEFPPSLHGEGFGKHAAAMSLNRAPGCFSIAPFRFDVTPPIGHPLLGGLVPAAVAVDDALEAIGYVLCGDEAPVVICVLDWAGLMNASYREWCVTLAEAAGTTPERVTVQCVHQHNTPFVCAGAQEIAGTAADPAPIFDPGFLAECLDRATRAVREAIPGARPVTHVAHGQATVDQVASNRRVDRDASGQVQTMRGSACEDAALRALPVGLIDPSLQTVAFYDGDQKIVSCHYYATHPMSYYRDGRMSSDFCGLARKLRQREEPDCAHLYFSGCAGNIAAGKYNEGTPADRVALTERIHAGILAAEERLTPQPLEQWEWRSRSILPEVRASSSIEALGAGAGGVISDRAGEILQAYRESWQNRLGQSVPVLLSCLRLNEFSVIHLPGEPFVEYQLRARALRPGLPVAVAAYGDGGPWYIPTEPEYSQGGYETTVAFCEPTIDGLVTTALQELLA